MIMQVNIPKPCSENWGEMTPTQRGAFCKTCAIDVIDFSNKSPDEVKQTLKANIGKHMCGRFKKGQLTDLSIAYKNWENQSARTFQSKFLWACMIAFGMTLFVSCGNSAAQSPLSNQVTVLSDSTKTSSDSTLNSVDSVAATPIDYTDFITGDIAYIEEPEEVLMGEPAIIDIPEEEIIDSTVNSTQQHTPPVISCPPRSEMIKGKFVAPENFEPFLVDTTQVKEEKIPVEVHTDFIDATLYPNPAVNSTTLTFTPKTEGYFEIELYSINGTKIQTISTRHLNSETQFFQLSLDRYPPGTYLIHITGMGERETLKFNKVQ